MRHPYDDFRSTSPMAMMIDRDASAISHDRPYRSIDPMRPERRETAAGNTAALPCEQATSKYGGFQYGRPTVTDEHIDRLIEHVKAQGQWMKRLPQD